MMKPDDLDALMRAGEVYHTLQFPPLCWTVLRVDGRSFTRLTDEWYERPFDATFHGAMVEAAEAILADFNGVFGGVHSDEISILLPRAWDAFDREVEKTVSVAAGLASAIFTQRTGHVGGFDGRAWIGSTDQQVVDYFRWRQADALRGALNSMAYWRLRQDGKSERAASAMLHRQGVSFKNELLFTYGINFNDTPLWQRRGTVLYWEAYAKVGHNPLSGADVTVTRRRIVRDSEPPMGEAYDALIRARLRQEGSAGDQGASSLHTE